MKNKISVFQKVKLLFRFLTVLHLLPFKFAIIKFFNPIDSTRYVEFIYFLDFLKDNKIKKGEVIDISSPFLMSYFLCKNFKVLKTDINEEEKKYIKENKNLKFIKADGTSLMYQDNSFDISYSISVVEHIYNKYIDCINEMIRVTKPGGLIYVTFPVSKAFLEEWIDNNIYSDQHKDNEKTFFQYRFGENELYVIKNNLNNIEVLKEDIYWENVEGEYDRMTNRMRKTIKNKYLELIRYGFINYYYGFTLLSEGSSNFKNSKSFGNYQAIFKKK